VIKPLDIPSEESRILVVKQAADALAAAGTLDEAAVSVLQTVCVSMEWQRGELWIVDRVTNQIRLQWSWHDPATGGAGARMDIASRGMKFGPGGGMAGQVWRSGVAMSVPDVTRDPIFIRQAAAGAAGLHGAVAVPIRGGGAVLGVLIFLTNRVRQPNASALALLSVIAAQIGCVLRLRPGEATATEQVAPIDSRLAAERAARELAERAIEQKDEFLAIIAHQLRTPLNAILGWAQVLRRARDLSEVNDAVIVIERNARTQNVLIEDLLDLSRVISGQIRLDSNRVELDQVIEAAIDAVLPDATAKHVRIDTSIEPFAAPIMGDAARLQQIVWNLLSNSVRYCHEGGRIRVTLDADGDDDSEATITVTDNGAGIAADELPHVFERFHQGAAGARDKASLGLGLAISKELIEMHGGTIRVESEGPGKGSTFTVRLPLAVLFTEPAAAMRSGVDGQSGSRQVRLDGVSVLLVDEEPDQLRFVESILRDHGASVTTTDGMASALAALDGAAFDALVSDISMPEHDGYELIHRVRQRTADKGGLIRAVALTALTRETDRNRSLGAGFNMHINKPVDADDLVSALGRLIGTRLQMSQAATTAVGQGSGV
jgi:signal transduction histidine kinase/ActR/RegA family two-component response regulator